MSAFAGADTSRELSTEECRKVIDDIAVANPNVFLILTGGEPLLRKDIFDLAACSADKGFTVVLGTNGVLLREPQAKQMRQSGIQGRASALTRLIRISMIRSGGCRGLARGRPSHRGAARRGPGFLHPYQHHQLERGRNPRDDRSRTRAWRQGAEFFFLVRTGRGEPHRYQPRAV